MKILILAAGYAIRLYPLTLDMPKPLLEIGGRKIIDRILDKVAGLEDNHPIYIITNGKFFEKFNSWRNRSKYKDRISLVNDGSISNETRLGAIKDLEITLDRSNIDDDLLVIAGDNLFDLDLNDFLRFASKKKDGTSVGLYDIGDLKAAKSFGVVEIDAKKRVIDFEEKPQAPKSTLVSTGIYYFPRSKLSFIKDYVKSQDKKLDAPGYYISWLATADKVYGFEFSEDWYDIGSIESLEKADREYSKKERKGHDKA